MPRIVLTLAFALALSVSALATQNISPDAPTAGNQMAILVTTIAGFASLLLTQIFSYIKDGRNRRWDLADREAAREEVRERAEKIQRQVELQRLETIQTAIELAKVSSANRDQLIHLLQQNRDISLAAKDNAVAALESANTFNEKLERLWQQFVNKGKTIDHIDEVSADTNVKVTDLRGDVEHDDNPPRRRRS